MLVNSKTQLRCMGSPFSFLGVLSCIFHLFLTIYVVFDLGLLFACVSKSVARHIRHELSFSSVALFYFLFSNR